jgi:hypothetical protein
MKDQLIKKAKQLVRGAEMLLSHSFVQARTGPAKHARACLIRQIYYGDRVLAHLRDDTDHHTAFIHLERNVEAAHRALDDMRNLCDETDRR